MYIIRGNHGRFPDNEGGYGGWSASASPSASPHYDSFPYPTNGNYDSGTAATHSLLREKTERQRCFGKALLYLTSMVVFTWIAVCYAMADKSVRYSLIASQDTATGAIAGAGLVSMGLLWLLEQKVSVLASAEQGETSTARHSQDSADLGAHVLLFFFTVSQSVVVSVPCALMAHLGLAPLVIASFGMTFFLFVGLTIFALQTKYDFTSLKGMVLMAIQGFLLWSLFGFDVGTAVIVTCLVIFMVYVIIAVQETLKKARPGKAVAMLAAVKLYGGFMNIFLRILHLMIISKLQENKDNRFKRRRA